MSRLVTLQMLFWNAPAPSNDVLATIGIPAPAYETPELVLLPPLLPLTEGKPTSLSFLRCVPSGPYWSSPLGVRCSTFQVVCFPACCWGSILTLLMPPAQTVLAMRCVVRVR